MTQQMGSASGTAPVSRANEAAPGGASGLTSESMTNGEASGGAPRVTEADWQEPGSAEPAGLRPAGPAVDTASADGIGSANGTAAGTLTGAVGGVIIQPDGYVSLVSVGDIYAAGKTIPELTENIQTAYSKILHDPVVNITLKDFEKPYFTALGQVGKPGKYDLRGETTLAQGVALAGGFTTKGAKTSQVLLFRQVSDDWIEVRKIDVKKMLNGKDLREDVHLRAGDMIYVPTSIYSKVEPYIPKASLALWVQ